MLVIIGLCVILYPVVATYWNNYQQQSAAQAYAELETATPQEVLNEHLLRAQEYNKTVDTGPILDPWLARVAKDNGPYMEYARRLNLRDTMSRIIVPAAKVDLATTATSRL